MNAPRVSIDTYSTSDGFEFSLVHFTSEKIASDDVVIYIHGNGSANALKDVRKMNAMASRFAENNIDFIFLVTHLAFLGTNHYSNLQFQFWLQSHFLIDQ